MRPKIIDRGRKRSPEIIELLEAAAKRRRQPTQRLLESQEQMTPPPARPSQLPYRASPPINAPSFQSRPSQRTSPRRQLPIHPLFSPYVSVEDAPFESQVRDNKGLSALLPPDEGSTQRQRHQRRLLMVLMDPPRTLVALWMTLPAAILNDCQA